MTKSVTLTRTCRTNTGERHSLILGECQRRNRPSFKMFGSFGLNLIYWIEGLKRLNNLELFVGFSGLDPLLEPKNLLF